MNSWRSIAQHVSVLALLLLPGVAAACPSCAGGEAPGNGKLLLMAGMMLFPWGVAAVVFRTLREVEDSAHDS